MGSWEATCGISHLPITGETPIRCVIIVGSPWHIGTGSQGIVRTPETWDPKLGHGGDTPEMAQRVRLNNMFHEGWWSGYCEVADIFRPRGLPLKGHYADYGMIDGIEPCLNLDILKHGFSQDLDEYKGQRESGGPDAIKRGMPFPDLLHSIERNNATVKSASVSGKAEHSPLGLWFVREDIYQAVISSKIDGGHYAGSRLSSLKEFQKQAKAYLEDLKKINTPEAIRSPNGMVSMTMMREERHDIFEALRWVANGWFRSSEDWLVEQIVAGKLKPDGSDVIALVNDMAEFAFFCFAMAKLRIGFMPQMGTGSQDTTTSIHKAVAKQVLKSIKDMEVEYQ